MSSIPNSVDVRSTRVIRIEEGNDLESFAESVRRGLGDQPKHLACQFFYDELGSQLFEQICEQPEYYPTRTEDAILLEHADAMVGGFTGDRPPALVELGSGSSSKTRRLIEAALDRSGELHYLPIDVSPEILEASGELLVNAYPGLRVTGYAADYRVALRQIAGRLRRPKLIAFLGSSLGNFDEDDARDLLTAIGEAMGPLDRLLLGTDLDKNPAVLEAAYDDAEGVSARFNLNILTRINRELGGDFDLDRFTHRARYRPDRKRVEMHLESQGRQTVEIPGAEVVAHFEDGETIHTENSHKYTVESLRGLAESAGLVEESAWTDTEGLFRVQRWRTVSS